MTERRAKATERKGRVTERRVKATERKGRVKERRASDGKKSRGDGKKC